MTPRRHRCARAFSLIELVIVVIILGIVAAIALPRITRGSEGAEVAALWADVEALNKAVELYTVEHGAAPDKPKIVSQLTQYSNAGGGVFSGTPDPANGVIYGPYLHKIPTLKLGPNAGASGIDSSAGPDIGWIYNQRRRSLRPNFYDGGGNIPPDLLNKLKMTQDEAESIGGLGDDVDAGEIASGP